MPEPKKLYTLMEVAERAGISYPTLQRYKEKYQGRIPSVGAGARERYPEDAIAEVRKIHQEVEDDPAHAEL
ncbi:MAG: helix-turn-helix domain-containing protein [Thermoanaerobaculia bacterium]